MTVQILANPGEEFERILQTVEQMPISNADNQQERFPKKISRKLFPRSGDSKYHRQFERAIRDDDGVTSSGSLPTESSTSMRRESMVGSAHSAHSGSQRKREEPLSDEAMESSPLDHAALKRPIERERKPYAAIPGAGRIAEEDRKMDPLIGSMPVRTGRSGSMSQARAPPYLKSFGDAPSAENPVGSAYRFPPRAQSNASEVFPNAHGGMNNVLGGNDTERATNSYARTASVKGRRRSRSVSRNGYEAGYRRSGADLSASMNDMSSDDSHGGHRTSRRSRRGPDDNRRSYHREKCEDVKHNEQARARVYEVGGREREDDEYHGRSTGQYYRP